MQAASQVETPAFLVGNNTQRTTAALKHFGTEGATVKEIASLTGLTSDIVRPRLSELRARDKAQVLGRRNHQQVWDEVVVS